MPMCKFRLRPGNCARFPVVICFPAGTTHAEESCWPWTSYSSKCSLQLSLNYFPRMPRLKKKLTQTPTVAKDEFERESVNVLKVLEFITPFLPSSLSFPQINTWKMIFVRKKCPIPHWMGLKMAIIFPLFNRQVYRPIEVRKYKLTCLHALNTNSKMTKTRNYPLAYTRRCLVISVKVESMHA